MTISIQRLLKNIKDLPPTPQVFKRLQKILKDDDLVLMDILPMIKMDAPICAQVLKISNSSFFALPEPALSIEEAVNRIGFMELYKIVCILTFNKVLSKELQIYEMASGQLWEHSLACAVILEILSQYLNEDVQKAYTLGLIHCLGKVIVNAYFLENPSVLRSECIKGMPTEEQAIKILGFDDAAVCAGLLQMWEFSQELIEPIRYYKNPENASNSKMAKLLHFAATCVPLINGKSTNLPYEAASKLGINEKNFQQAVEVMKEKFLAALSIMSSL